MREYIEYFNFELEIVESEDCTNNLEDIVTNINIEDTGLSHFQGLNHHLQKEKAFIHKEVMEYRAKKSRIYSNNPRRPNNFQIEDIGLDLENEEISRILGQSFLQPNRNVSQIVNKSVTNLQPKSQRIIPCSQILPTEIMESYSNLPSGPFIRPYSMRNVSPSSTYQRNIKKTRAKLRKKSQNINTSRITSHVPGIQEYASKSNNGFGFMTNSRMQKSLLTDLSVQSVKKNKQASNQSTTWNLLNPDQMKTHQTDQMSLVHLGKSNIMDFSKRNHEGQSIAEINTNIQHSLNLRPTSKMRKSVMFQYQKIKQMQNKGENSMYGSRQSKSQIEIGMNSSRYKRRKFGQSRDTRKSWNGMALYRK